MKKVSRILCIALSVILVFGVAAAAIACPGPGDKVKVTFNYADRDPITIEVEKGKKIPDAKLPVDHKPASDKIFLHWSEEGSSDNYISKGKPGKDITLSATFRDRAAGEFVVWFDPEGGSHIPTQVVKTNQKATKPSTPTKERATFEHWQIIGGGGEFEFSTAITEDYFLKAIWNEGAGLILVQSSGDFDKVFSPFFSSSAYDGGVVSETQISMISSDRKGKPYVGEDVPSVVKDYNHTTYINNVPNPNADQISSAMLQNPALPLTDFYTEYQFVIKNGIQFSDGTDLTMKDIIFNMYVYLDRVYSGSSTMYSTKIEGLQAYRMQDPSLTETSGGDNESYFVKKADTRIGNLEYYFPTNEQDLILNRDDLAGKFYDLEKTRNIEQIVMEDAYYLRELLWQELKSDAMSAWAMTETTKDRNGDGKVDADEAKLPPVIRGYEEYGFEEGENWKIFLLNAALLTVKRDDATGFILKYDNSDGNLGKEDYPKKMNDPWIEFNGTEKYAKWNQKELVMVLFNSMVGILENTGNDDSRTKDTAGGPICDLRFDASDNVIGSTIPLGNIATDKNNLSTFVGIVSTPKRSSSLTASLTKITSQWGSGMALYQYMINDEKSCFYAKSADEEWDVPQITGIRVKKVGPTQENKTFVNQEGKEKKYDKDHDVLSVTIWGIDPQAIWNFGFAVAPMHYYSNTDGKGTDYTDKDDYRAFNYEGCKDYVQENPVHVGFSRFDLEYFNKVIRHPDVLGVPMGAGAFKASNGAGLNAAPGVIKPSEFCADSQVNFRRNEYFNTTGEEINNVKFEYLKTKVIDTSKVVEALSSRDIHVGDPNAKDENINEIKKTSYLNYDVIDNNGYGYVGINAKFVPDIEVRQAIMHALNTKLIESYYTPALVDLITRPMSMVNWAYPVGAKDAYPYMGDKDTKDVIMELIGPNGANFSDKEMKEGAWTKSTPDGKRDLKFTFTIAGASNDHPAFQMFLEAAKLLNQCGFKITVKTDPYALSKLSSGSLAIWAAAWGSAIDPDMYQVYHPKSTATSVNNWGYPWLLSPAGGTQDEKDIIDELAGYIEQGRQSMQEAVRIRAYANALDLIMDLAVEYPTYQRRNLIAYNKNKIDSTSLSPNPTPFHSPFSEIWNIRLLS